MRNTLKFLAALVVALLIMLAFRALVFTIYTVPGNQLEPVFQPGDRVMVNRWSYGLRTHGEGLFPYGRILRQPVGRGDLVAVNDSLGQVVICRCTAVPGDSVATNRRRGSAAPMMIVPGVVTCADQDYYWMEHVNRKSHGWKLGLIPEECIIGRVFLIVYNHDDRQPVWRGYRRDRWFLFP